jgi:hypothetical protein
MADSQLKEIISKKAQGSYQAQIDVIGMMKEKIKAYHHVIENNCNSERTRLRANILYQRKSDK